MASTQPEQKKAAIDAGWERRRASPTRSAFRVCSMKTLSRRELLRTAQDAQRFADGLHVTGSPP